MKHLRKTLALILALALCVSLCVFPALAEDEFVIEDGVLVKYNGPGGDVVIPDGVTSIGDGAFRNRTSLTSVTIPSSVTTIGVGAFYRCDSLTSVTIPDGVTTIEYRAFYWCDSLTSVTISSSVTGIGEGAFGGCDNLENIFVVSGNDTYCDVDGVLFTKDKSSLIQYPGGKSGSYTVPNGVTTIEVGTFSDCVNLTRVTIPNSVTTIGDSSFWNCYSLTSVTIPSSVTSIGGGAFSACLNLKTIFVASGNDAYCDVDGILFTKDKSSLIQYPAGKPGSSYAVPDGVTTIEVYAFAYCDSLTSVMIPDGVTTIEHEAFLGCGSLTSVTIPNSVTTIRYGAFYGCDSTDIYYGGSEEEWPWILLGDDFSILPSNATIHYNSTGPTIAGFNDVFETDYYADAVTWAAAHEPVITLGYGGGVFGGGDGVKRAQAVTFLWRAAGEPEPEASANPFSDVKESEYYYKPVLWAAEKGITLGNGDGTFGPDSNVTRLQMLTFMARTAGIDVSGANWVEIAEDWAAENGLSDGIPGVVDNGGDCPRSDVVYYLWKQLA